jgi:hypothetical protein
VGYSGDGGPAINAQLNTPLSVAIDSAGNLFIAEGGSPQDITGRIRKVSPNGTIGTVYTGRVYAMTADSAGDLFISGTMGAASGFYELSAAGVLSTIAVTGSLPAIANGSPAAQAYLFNPGGAGGARSTARATSISHTMAQYKKSHPPESLRPCRATEASYPAI